jgi:hypothetical protein
LIEYMKAQPYMMLMVQVHNRVYVRNDLPPPP